MKHTLLLVLLPLLHLSAQQPLDLKQCIELGLERNYAIRMVQNNQQIASNNATLGNAGYLPVADLSAGYSGTLNHTTQHLNSGTTQTNAGTHNQQLNAGIGLNWTVFDGFNIQANYSRLKEWKQKGELNTRLTIENFIASLAAEYFNYVQQNIRFGNLRYAVRLSKERLRIVEARYEIGASSRLEMHQAKVDFNADSSRFIKQQEVLYASNIRLNELLANNTMNEPLAIKDTVIDFQAQLAYGEFFDKTLAQNTLLLLAQKDKALGLLDVKTAQSQQYPYVKVNAGYGYTQGYYQTGAYDRQLNRGLNYGVTLGFNLYNGNNTKRKIRNAQLQLQNANLELSELENAVKADFANIWMAYQNNIQLTNLEKENLKTAHDNYEIAIDRYKLGELSGIELREAQNSLLEAEERLIQAQYNSKLCEISLNQISGQILSSYLTSNEP